MGEAVGGQTPSGVRLARIEDIGNHEGERVELRGWVHHRTGKGKLQFVILRDGSGFIQCVVFKRNVALEQFEAVKRAAQETSLVVRGTVRGDERAPYCGYEIDVDEVEIVSPPAREYPIGPKEHGVAFLMDHRHLWLRSRRQHAIARVRATLVRAIRDFFDSRGFLLVDAPVLTPNACEGTTTLFETDYHGRKAYLTQSGQLYMEAAAMAFGKVYCFGPTFRAEKSKTRRHLAEFWMVEPEIAWAQLDDIMDLAEDFVCTLVERVLEERRAELEVLERDTAPLEAVQKPFVRLHYDDAIAKLHELGSDITWGDDFGGDDETVLTKAFDRPLFVHRFPAAVKAFYMKRDPARPELALGVDLLAPEGYGEIIGGGQREDDLATLEAAIDAHGLPREPFEWYLDLRRYGSVPHGGFGLGLERAVAWVCGLHHVRETIAFPRMLERLTP